MTTRKTILAIAVAAASSSAFAVQPQDFNFQFGAGQQQLEVITENYKNLNISGNTTISSNSNNDAVNLYGVNLSGGLNHSGNISASGDFADGIDLDRSGNGSGPGVSVAGAFTNSGTIRVSGLGSKGVITDSSSLLGGFANSGTISATDPNSSIDAAGVVGIEFSNSVVNGFNNTGSITADGANAVAILSAPNDNDSFTGAKFGDTIFNNGSIRATGESSAAIALTDTIVDGGIENNGVISAAGTGADAIDFDGGVIEYIENKATGSIRATGQNTNGIVIDGGRFSTVPAGDKTGIINDGYIGGDKTGILIENQNLSFPEISIQQKGGEIVGGQNAIDGGNHASLNWTGGKVTGNLIQLNNVTINGNGLLFAGDKIQAAEINIETGKLVLTGAHSTFMGNLTLGNNTTLEMLVGDSTVPTTAMLQVTGGVTVGADSAIALAARTENFRAAATEYTILSAGGGITNAENLKVKASSQLLTVTGVSNNNGVIKATIEAKGYDDLAKSVIAGGGNINAANAASAFSSGVMGQLDSNDPVFKALANADTEAELARIAQQLSPDVNGGSNTAASNSQNLVNSALNDRSASGRGAAGGDLLSETGIWMQALNTDAEQDMRNGIEGFNADSNGIVIGADGKLSEQTTVGLAYSYLTTDVKSDGGNKTDTKGHALTMYSSWEQDNWFVNGSMTYGVNDNESKRYIAGSTAKGDFDSELFGINAAAGYAYRLNESLIAEPQVAARYSNIESDSYSESGSSAALKIDAQRFEIGEIGAGARLAGSYALGKGVIEPEAKVMLWHDVIGDSASTTSTFLLGGGAFSSSGATADRNSVQAGLGVNYLLGAWSVGASYDYLTKTDYNADTFSAKVRYDF